MKLYQPKRGSVGMDRVDICNGESVAVSPRDRFIITGCDAYEIRCTMRMESVGKGDEVTNRDNGQR